MRHDGVSIICCRRRDHCMQCNQHSSNAIRCKHVIGKAGEWRSGSWCELSNPNSTVPRLDDDLLEAPKLVLEFPRISVPKHRIFQGSIKVTRCCATSPAAFGVLVRIDGPSCTALRANGSRLMLRLIGGTLYVTLKFYLIFKSIYLLPGLASIKDISWCVGGASANVINTLAVRVLEHCIDRHPHPLPYTQAPE
jgi:hypothetical protein